MTKGQGINHWASQTARLCTGNKSYLVIPTRNIRVTLYGVLQAQTCFVWHKWLVTKRLLVSEDRRKEWQKKTRLHIFQIFPQIFFISFTDHNKHLEYYPISWKMPNYLMILGDISYIIRKTMAIYDIWTVHGPKYRFLIKEIKNRVWKSYHPIRECAIKILLHCRRKFINSAGKHKAFLQTSSANFKNTSEPTKNLFILENPSDKLFTNHQETSTNFPFILFTLFTELFYEENAKFHKEGTV